MYSGTKERPMDTTQLEDYQLRDVETLIGLFTAKDPRSLEQIIADDTEYAEHEIEKMSPSGENAFELGFDGGWMSFFTFPDGDCPPAVGDTLRIYGSFGHRRHGFAINGKVIHYETPWEQFAERITMLAGFDRGHRERLEAERTDMEKWYALLEGPFKARIDRMRESKPDFDVDGGSYEMYPVVMAQRITAWVKEQPEETALEAITRFRNLPYEDQSKVIHAGEEDKYGISGHQFDFSCGIARAACDGQDI
jgi:hypothetical protein